MCTVPLLLRKMRRHLLGDSELAVKNRKESVVVGKRGGEREREKTYPGSPEMYLFWLPASLKLPVGDFKMAPLPATEWALPCQNVFEWKTQTENFPPLSPSLSLYPIVFLSCSLVLSSSASLPPFCPSFIAHRKGISPSPVKLSLNAAFALRKTLSSSLSFPHLPHSLEPCQSSLSW